MGFVLSVEPINLDYLTGVATIAIQKIKQEACSASDAMQDWDISAITQIILIQQ